jgi:hypothetical protein
MHMKIGIEVVEWEPKRNKPLSKEMRQYIERMRDEEREQGYKIGYEQGRGSSFGALLIGLLLGGLSGTVVVLLLQPLF